MLYKIHENLFAVEDLPLAYLALSDNKALLLADIHLGFEEYMATKGVFLPRLQLKKVIEVIERGLSTINADTLIIVGDVKHLFDKLGRRESKDLGEFLTYVKKKFNRVVLVRGNHDNFVYSLSMRYGVEFYENFQLSSILFIHGHKDFQLNGFSLVIMGHEHPSIVLKDPVTEVVAKFPCFLKVPLQNTSTLVILPAAGAYQSGTAVSTSVESFLSPIVKKYGVLREAIPYAIVESEGVYELPTLAAIEGLLAAL
ncbi:MAG: metallophosphoesterase [Ignisphaera sp.]|jgi:putative SbcD/Mre11-related phosphoesterase|nr:metallophosphoesterase [Ignisphaera sp.]MCC6056074.1 metallophosphoesterase [Desulfurococcaceae archaeon]